jgi:hypothetical protein
MFKENTHSTPVETSRVQFLPFLKKLGFFGSLKKRIDPVLVLVPQKNPRSSSGPVL